MIFWHFSFSFLYSYLFLKLFIVLVIICYNLISKRIRKHSKLRHLQFCFSVRVKISPYMLTKVIAIDIIVHSAIKSDPNAHQIDMASPLAFIIVPYQSAQAPTLFTFLLSVDLCWPSAVLIETLSFNSKSVYCF